MKKILVILTLTLTLFSCSSGPETAAKNFSENMAKGKIDEAKKYATQSTGKLLDFVNAMGKSDVDPDFEFHFVKDSIVDNKAWVTAKNKEGKEDTIELVKIDGEWLVHLDTKK